MFNEDDVVRSTKHGVGTIVKDDGQTAVVQFGHGIERCLSGELQLEQSPRQSLAREQWDPPLPVISRVLGEAIQSVNDRWGVFSRSKIALLPHQLWVCRKVLESWPARWLVADDVGLGKTIEAGLILWPVLSREKVRRLLILCPASLVEQWQLRLKDMFDIRLFPYVAEADTKTSDFWHLHPQVVASLQTLRTNSNERHARMLEAPRWDLVVVDEGHHLNADEKGGPTLGYQLVEKLSKHNQIDSMVFFTGTPHRGKNFGFLSLLHLLRPDLFNPKLSLKQQLSGLRQVMIRNNKQNVTDLKGNRLFIAPKVVPRTYEYSPEEARFYAMLTEFITTGKAYASSQSSSAQRTIILVLISMQKLASSSIAAIRRALVRRLERLRAAQAENDERRQAARDMLESYSELEEEDADRLAALEESLAEKVELQLVGDEPERLAELIAAADQVQTETKIHEILGALDGSLAGRSVLFFTEYKATQSLLISALQRKFGDGCAAFINGDGRADSIIMHSGQIRSLTEDRRSSADRFNSASVRFLVSTEAAGEGIDLQRNCHTLIHVDLPWNPMRLHQRVGRLYRYGQTRQVEVFTWRNPSTVESRIWDKLEEKIENITTALDEVMDEPEDLMELVLGMTSPQLFREVFSEAEGAPRETLGSWFDQKTARFGDRDTLDMVRDLVGNVARFDFQEMSEKIPKLDLPALKPFFLSMLRLNGRRYQDSQAGLSFKMPDGWLRLPSARSDYANMVFSRNADNGEKVLGFGHTAFHEAVRQSRELSASTTALPSNRLSEPLAVFKVSERLTSTTQTVRSALVGVAINVEKLVALSDWQLVGKLNDLLEKRSYQRTPAPARPSESAQLDSFIHRAQKIVEQSLECLDISFQVPDISLFAVLCPTSSISDADLSEESES